MRWLRRKVEPELHTRVTVHRHVDDADPVEHVFDDAEAEIQCDGALVVHLSSGAAVTYAPGTWDAVLGDVVER